MKWTYAFVALALFASSAFAYDEDVEANDARLGYINVGTNGVTSLTFNATSIQNAVILLLFLGLIGALIAPLFLGASGGESTDGYGYGYGQEQTGYEEPATGYAGYAKRSLLNNFAGPLLENLSAAHKKYEADDE